MRIGAQVLDGSVLPSLGARQRRDGRHLRGEIEAGQFGLRQTNRASDDQFVHRAGDSQVGGKRSALQRRSGRQDHAQRGQHGLKIVYRHAVGVSY
ncbi:MAG: hypothetical protein DMG46_26030 [Acidobacteria bacterium]|nr:MAG: hypothetical protein DMG46_26030 [Acidobacteriota bacterium]